MRDVFKQKRLMIETDVVEQDQMLVNLTHITNVWNDRDMFFSRHQRDGDKLAYAGDAESVNLAETERV